MSRRTPVGLLLLAAFLCAGIAAQAAEVQRFAVVNLEKVFREYRKSRIAEDAFKQQAEVYRNYFVKQQGLLVQLRKQAEQLQEEARNPALSEADRSKAGADAVVKAREVAAKEAELKLYAAERLRTMRDAEQKKREEVFADIYKEIDRRAAAEGFTFVLDSSGKTMNEQPTVLRFPASCDLTEAVIRELNRTMSEAEKKEAAPRGRPAAGRKDGAAAGVTAAGVGEFTRESFGIRENIMKQLTLTAAEIAEMIKGKVVGEPGRVVHSVAGIKEAKGDQLSFIGNKRYEHQFETTEAGVILVCPDLESAASDKHTLIVTDHVDYAFATVVAVFAEKPPVFEPGVHPSAVVASDVKLGEGVTVGANAVIEPGVEIGDGAVIGAGCYLGHQVKIGAGTILYPNVTVMYRCTIGRKCILHPGVVIGADGFGFVPGPQGLVKVPQTGIVQIDDDVELGANTTVDRAVSDGPGSRAT